MSSTNTQESLIKRGEPEVSITIKNGERNMGKLKQDCLDIPEQTIMEVMNHYSRFLEFSWNNRNISSSYANALDHVSKKTGLPKFQIDYIITERIGSIYEGY